MNENTTTEELHTLADQCDSLASLLRDSKRNLPSWRLIVQFKVQELVQNLHELDLIKYDDQV